LSAQVIAIDAMGGDFGPRSIVQACIASLSATPSLHLTLVGQPSLLEELIASHPAGRSRAPDNYARQRSHRHG
jgi:glycerol-3-phosphate acyltransferase PlsX